MENWSEAIKTLYRAPSTVKEYLGDRGSTFSGASIVAGSVKLVQSISDAEQLVYGSVEPACLEFELSVGDGMDLITSTADRVLTADNYAFMVSYPDFDRLEINVVQKVDVPGDEGEVGFLLVNGTRLITADGYTLSTAGAGSVEYCVPIGVFTVAKCDIQGDTWFRKITAYDRLSRFDLDVSAWYNALDFTRSITLKAFRESLCAYIGVPYAAATLPNDGIVLEKTIEPTELSGTDVLSACCELCACWPQMSPEGTLRWVTLGAASCETFDYEVYEQTYRPESTRELYTCPAFNAVVIRATKDDVGGHYPATMQSNPYIIENNFLAYGKSTPALSAMAQNMLASIGGKPYRPHTTAVQGRPYLQCGDRITVRTQKETYTTYILKRTMTGESSLVDTYEARGMEEASQNYGISRQIVQLKGKTNELVRTVDETRSTITDLEAETQSSIQQLANSISLVVDGSGNVTPASVVAAINEADSSVTISASKVNLSGYVTVSSLGVNGTTVIDGARIQTGTVAADRIDVEHLYVKHLDGADGSFSGSLSSGVSITSPIIKGGQFDTGSVDEGSGEGIRITNGEIDIRYNQNTVGAVYGSIGNELRLVGLNAVNIDVRNNGNWTVLNATINGVMITGDLDITGSASAHVKNCIHTTEHYGRRKFYCYETPQHYLGDIGEAAAPGRIALDPIFLECVRTDMPYQVFITPYGNGRVWVSERGIDGFTVSGEQIPFGWEIKAVRRGFEGIRLDEMEVI